MFVSGVIYPASVIHGQGFLKRIGAIKTSGTIILNYVPALANGIFPLRKASTGFLSDINIPQNDIHIGF